MNSTNLIENQKSSLAQIDSRLSNLISTRITPLGKKGIEKTRTILSSFGQCKQELHATITDFFLKLFADQNQEALFMQFSRLHQRGHSQAFFKYASTRALRNLTSVLSGFSKAPTSLLGRPLTSSWEVLCRKIPLTVLEKQSLLRCLQAFSIISNSDAQEFIEKMGMIHNIYGEELYSALASIFIENGVALADALWAIRELNDTYLPFEQIDAFSQGQLSWEDLVAILQETECGQIHHIWNQEDLSTLMERSSQMPFPLTPKALQTIDRQLLRVQEFYTEYANLKMETLARCAGSFKEREMDNEEKRLKLLAIGICALRRHFGITLHPTQALTILGLLSFPQGCLAQVNTGEGKSAIVALLSFLLVMERTKVHVVSSTHYLSTFGQEKFTPFFSSFSIETSHICENQPSFDKFQTQIIYGTAYDFEFAIQREMLQVKHSFPEPEQENRGIRFDCVIVDEVDNLTIDTILNEARIAFPAEISYDWVYSPILAFAQSGSKQDLREFLSLYEEGRFADAVSRLSNHQLESWKRSAHHVLNEIKEDEDYVVLPGAEKKEICIVDVNNTGRLKRGSRWGGGKHEFAETLHSIPVERESLTPLSLSHAVYYRLYRTIYGLSGTLGDQVEREEMRDIYQIENFDVPTYLPPLRIDYPPINLASKEALFEGILQAVRECQSAGRPILMLCDTIAFSKAASNLLSQNEIAHETLNEMQVTSEDVVLQRSGKPGAVTIATTAGRGTDIILDQESIQNGGLHVLLTFFPDSLRVEQQGRGRAGRQGQPGSSAILFFSPHSLDKLLSHRAMRAMLEKEHHLYIAKFSRMQFQLAQQFFSRFAAFHKMRDKIVKLLASKWAPRKNTLEELPILTKLPPKDQMIADTALALLSSTSTQEPSWNSLLHTTCERVETLVMENWARGFYQRAEELSHDFGSSCKRAVYTSLALRLAEVDLHQISQQIDTEIARMHAKTLAKMEGLFAEGCEPTRWDSYLGTQGEGVEKYLRQVIRGQIPALIS